MEFAAFFSGKKPFPVDQTDLKTVARWRLDWYNRNWSGRQYKSFQIFYRGLHTLISASQSRQEYPYAKRFNTSIQT